MGNLVHDSMVVVVVQGAPWLLLHLQKLNVESYQILQKIQISVIYNQANKWDADLLPLYALTSNLSDCVFPLMQVKIRDNINFSAVSGYATNKQPWVVFV